MADYIQNLQKISMLAIVEPDMDAFVRRVCRWYSKTFFTPLHEVENLPLEYVLQHYFEQIYEDLDKDARHNKIIYLLETPEERAIRVKNDEDAELAFLRQVQEEADRAKALELSKAKEQLSKVLPKNPLKPVQPPEEEITINYVDSDAIEDGMDEDFIPSKPK